MRGRVEMPKPASEPMPTLDSSRFCSRLGRSFRPGFSHSLGGLLARGGRTSPKGRRQAPDFALSIPASRPIMPPVALISPPGISMGRKLHGVPRDRGRHRPLPQIEPADLPEHTGPPEHYPRCKQASKAWTFIGNSTTTGESVYLCSGCARELGKDGEEANLRSAGLSRDC